MKRRKIWKKKDWWKNRGQLQAIWKKCTHKGRDQKVIRWKGEKYIADHYDQNIKLCLRAPSTRRRTLGRPGHLSSWPLPLFVSGDLHHIPKTWNYWFFPSDKKPRVYIGIIRRRMKINCCRWHKETQRTIKRYLRTVGILKNMVKENILAVKCFAQGKGGEDKQVEERQRRNIFLDKAKRAILRYLPTSTV